MDKVKLEYLICGACERPFGISATGHLMSERLPETFDALCPHCETKLTYERSAIHARDL